MVAQSDYIFRHETHEGQIILQLIQRLLLRNSVSLAVICHASVCHENPILRSCAMHVHCRQLTLNGHPAMSDFSLTVMESSCKKP